MVFTWNSNIDEVKSADIEVLDGNATSHFDITGSFQRTGVFVFPHRTANVQVVLRARTKHGDVVRSIGLVDGSQNAEDRRAEADGSGAAAARLDATNRRLAALVSVLESRRKPRRK